MTFQVNNGVKNQGSTYKTQITTNKRKVIKFLPLKETTFDDKYILGNDKFPLMDNKYVQLPAIIDKLFENNIVEKLNKSRIPNKTSAFVRKGVDKDDNKSFINAIAKVSNMNPDKLMKNIIYNLNPLLFIKLNNGELVKHFGVNEEKLNDKYNISDSIKISLF